MERARQLLEENVSQFKDLDVSVASKDILKEQKGFEKKQNDKIKKYMQNMIKDKEQISKLETQILTLI
jgi:hypothetical protein